MNYVPVMGLEIHAELLTKSKIFCSCANAFGGGRNERVCPVCAGMPGTLPVLNWEAVRLAVKAGLALGCHINRYSAFDRKNYFYPDLPKAYQITQFEYPLCSDGAVPAGDKTIRVSRIHMEEDAGKLTHDAKRGISYVDFNRCGVPLIEIVTAPDFRSVQEVQDFVSEAALRLKYAGVCDARLEQGSLRVDVNISLMPSGAAVFGTRAEIKNLNSLKSIGRAIAFEINRQTELLEAGMPVRQETRRFDERMGETVLMRSKEELQDYRYFPEPDIPPVMISRAEVDAIRRELPKMPLERVLEYTTRHGLTEEDARLIVQDRAFSDFYEETVRVFPAYKIAANLMLGELNRNLNFSGKTISEVRFTPAMLARLCELSKTGRVSKNAAKEILAQMFETGEDPFAIAQDGGFLMREDIDAVRRCVENVLKRHTSLVADYKNGNRKIFGFLMGQVMREAGKGVNPQVAKEELTRQLEQ